MVATIKGELRAKEWLSNLQGGSVNHNKQELIPIPLPTEIPAPPSIDQLPLDVIHSATVEMLLQQIDDLSSRLKVNIRRNSGQEQKILDLKKELERLERNNENLKAQNEIVKEKESLWFRQKEEQNRRMESQNKEMDLLQLRYNELYTTSQQRQKELFHQVVDKNQTIDALQKKLHVFRKIRLRAKDRLRDFLLQTLQAIHTGQAEAQQTMSKNRILKKQFESLSSEILEKEELFKKHLEEIKQLSQKKIDELQLKIQELTQDVEQKQQRHTDLKTENDKIFNELREEQKGRARIASLSRELSELKNENLSDKRKYIDMIKQLEDVRLRDQEKIKNLQSANQNQLLQTQEQKSALEACEQKLLELRKDNQDLEYQLESLQSLWVDAQDKLEKESLKRKTLEKINRELSRDSDSQKVSKSIERAQTAEVEIKAVPVLTQESKVNSRLTEVIASQYNSINKNRQPEI